MTALADMLERLDTSRLRPSSILTRLRQYGGGEVGVEGDAEVGLRATFPAGRLIVAPGQTIASAWGNTTYDQGMVTFANAAERDAQWPTPHDGAQCYLVDQQMPYQRVSGGWRTPPKWVYTRGYGMGPGSPNPAWPTKLLVGRAQVTTDAAGRAAFNLAPIYTEAGVSPVPTVLTYFHYVGMNISLQCNNEAGLPISSVNSLPLRVFNVAGTAYAGTFNILFQLAFQNGAT